MIEDVFKYAKLNTDRCTGDTDILTRYTTSQDAEQCAIKKTTNNAKVQQKKSV